MRITEEDIKIFLGIFISVSLSILIFSLVFIHKEEPEEITKEMKYKAFAQNNTDDLVIDLIYQKCYILQEQYEQVKCINDAFSSFYIYKDHEGVNTPKEIFIRGGVCRDSAIFYNTIFDKMNFTNRVEILDELHHVINIVEYEGGYCTVDQQNLNCLETKNGK